MRHPGFDFAVIPDVIDGSEKENDDLIDQWPFGTHGSPVWHVHESIDRLIKLCKKWPRVCLGSSGEYSSIGKIKWWLRMDEAFAAICDKDHQPITKLHGLRILDPAIFQHIPLKSGDSTNLARNHSGKRAGHFIIKQYIEDHNSSCRWERKIKENEEPLF